MIPRVICLVRSCQSRLKPARRRAGRPSAGARARLACVRLRTAALLFVKKNKKNLQIPKNLFLFALSLCLTLYKFIMDVSTFPFCSPKTLSQCFSFGLPLSFTDKDCSDTPYRTFSVSILDSRNNSVSIPIPAKLFNELVAVTQGFSIYPRTEDWKFVVEFSFRPNPQPSNTEENISDASK